MSNRLTEIKATLAKITPGPWKVVREDSNLWIMGKNSLPIPCDTRRKHGEENAAFIAAAPQDIAALVAFAEKLREGLEYVKNDNENPLGFATDSQVAEHFLELADAALTNLTAAPTKDAKSASDAAGGDSGALAGIGGEGGNGR